MKRRLTATLVIRSTRYHGHFFWPPGKNQHTFSCKKNLVNTATPLIWPIFFWLIGDRINGVPLYILFRSRQKPTIIVSDTITLDNIAVQQVELTKFLGVLLGTDRSP